jgi:hypothetical protein
VRHRADSGIPTAERYGRRSPPCGSTTVPDPDVEPLTITDEVTALRAALAEAVSLLAAVDSDANNVQIDIARWRRRHHKVVPDA